MQRKGQRKGTNYDYLTVSCILVSGVLITPQFNFDPIHLPRLFAISSIAGLCLVIIAQTLRIHRWQLNSINIPVVILGAIFFTLSVLNTLIFSGANVITQLYGTQGRLNGALSYLALTIILCALSVRSPSSSQSLDYPMYLVGTSNVAYGLLQHFELDPVPWQNPYNPIVGFVGNPNFMSSFLGIYFIFLISKIVYFSQPKKLVLYLLLFASAIDAFLIFATRSIQGVFLAIFGSCVILIIRFQLQTRLKFWILFPILSVPLLTVVILGLIGQGPLGSRLYESTLMVRLFYWKAAIRMLMEHPVHGLGFDTFGSFYSQFRDIASVKPYGPGLVTNSAHNYYLDVAAYGGFPLLISYVFIVVLVTLSCLKLFSKTRTMDGKTAFLVAAWFGYLLQSLVSINNLSLGVLGAVVGGQIVSLTNTSHVGTGSSKVTRPSTLNVRLKFVALLLGATIALPPLINDIQFRRALSEGEGNRLIEIATKQPFNDYYMYVTASLLVNSGYEKLGQDLAQKALTINPNNVSVIRLLMGLSSVSESEKKSLGNRLSVLDPLGK